MLLKNKDHEDKKGFHHLTRLENTQNIPRALNIKDIETNVELNLV